MSALAIDLDGGGVIRELRLKLAQPSGKTLRGLVLQIAFEDPQNICVRVPVGDFFGTGAGEHRFQSLPCGMTADGYYAFFSACRKSAAATAPRPWPRTARSISCLRPARPSSSTVVAS